MLGIEPILMSQDSVASSCIELIKKVLAFFEKSGESFQLLAQWDSSLAKFGEEPCLRGFLHRSQSNDYSLAKLTNGLIEEGDLLLDI